MDVLFVFPKSQEAQKEMTEKLAQFQANQAAKYVQRLPCPVEEKLELLDAAARHICTSK